MQSLAIVFNASYDGSRFIQFHYQLGQANGFATSFYCNIKNMYHWLLDVLPIGVTTTTKLIM
jgi:hypothetical protein